MWHKVNFQVAYSWFEFIFFLLLVWLPYRCKRRQSDLIFIHNLIGTTTLARRTSLSSVQTTCLELRSTKSEKMASSWLREEAKDTPQKQSRTPTTLMTWRYWRIRLIKQRHYCIVWNEPQLALASMSMHTKLNICVTTKRATLPH